MRAHVLACSLAITLLPMLLVVTATAAKVHRRVVAAETVLLTDLHPILAQASAYAIRHRQSLPFTPDTPIPHLNDLETKLLLIHRSGLTFQNWRRRGPLPVFSSTRAGNEVSFRYRGTSWLGLGQPLPHTDWTLYVARPAPKDLQVFEGLLPLMLPLALSLALVGIIGGLYLGEAYTRPVDQLTRKLRGLARGDFSPIVCTTPIRELQQLGTTLGEMARHQQQKFNEIAHLNETLRIQYEEIGSHFELLKSLGAVSQSLIAPTSLTNLLNEAFPKILEICHLEVGALFMLNGPDGAMHLQIAHGLTAKALSALQTSDLPNQLPGQAASFQQVLVTENLPADPRQNVAVYRDDGLEAIIHIPLLANGVMIGVLALGSRQPGHFTAQEVSTLITVANQLAIAIQNVQLYQQTANTKGQLETIINAMSEGLVVTDANGRIILVNRWAEILIGEESTWFGHPFAELVDTLAPSLAEPETLRGFAERLFQEPDKVHRTEIEPMTPTHRFLDLKGTPIISPDNQVLGWIVVVQDTTHEREAQLALDLARSRLEAIFHGLPHPVFVIDNQERIVAANPAFLSLYGLEPPLRLASFLAHTAPWYRDSAEVGASLRRALHEPFNGPMELELLYPEHRVYQVITQPLANPDGTYTGALAVYQDITAERETARWQANFIGRLEALVADRTRTLKEKDRRLSNLYTVLEVFRRAHTHDDLVALIPRELCAKLEFDRAALYLIEGRQLVCAAAWSLDGEADAAMAQARRTTAPGHVLAAAVASEAASIVSSESRENVLELLGARRYAVVPIKPRDELLGFLLVNRRTNQLHDGELELVSVFANVAGFALLNMEMVQTLESHNRELERALGQLQHAYDDLQGAQSQLIRAEKMATIGQVAAGVAHEIKNRFNVISMAGYYIKMRLGDTLEPAIAKSLTRMESEIDRGSRMITDLLQMAKPTEPHVEALDIATVIDEALGVASKPTVRIERQLPADLPPVRGDRSQLQQVFLNLILNAVQAMPNGGRLIVRAYPVPGSVVVEIDDDGVGIPETHLQQLFNPFFTTKREGTGLGLGITQAILEHHQASIAVRSTVGEGTVFAVTLPQAERPIEAVPAPLPH